MYFRLMNPKKRILVAPLNWGLGHATRCIPIIQNLIHCGEEIRLACREFSFFRGSQERRKKKEGKRRKKKEERKEKKEEGAK